MEKQLSRHAFHSNANETGPALRRVEKRTVRRTNRSAFATEQHHFFGRDVGDLCLRRFVLHIQELLDDAVDDAQAGIAHTPRCQ